MILLFDYDFMWIRRLYNKYTRRYYMNFSSLKKQSTAFDRLRKEVDKLSNPTFEKDETEELFWKPTPDKSGNALAVIRFLPTPAVDGDDALPFIRYWDHGFQGKATGKWYIERSLTTFDEKDPVSEYNSKLWNSTQDDNSPERKQARDQKRRLHYVSVIKVISDPKNPDAEGKVFYFKYGKKIMDKITKMMNPDLETEQSIDPFHFWHGANFKLKVTRQNVNIGGRNVSFPNYDESVFLPSTALSDDDKELEAIWKAEPSLKDLNDRRHYKTYDELKRRLDDVLGLTSSATSTGTTGTRTVTETLGAGADEEDVPFTNSKPATRKSQPTPTPASTVDEDEDDADLAMFKKLAED
jgi:hypothetical protein